MGARKAGDAEEFKALWHALRAPERSAIRAAAIIRVRELVAYYGGSASRIGEVLGVTDRSARRLVAAAPAPMVRRKLTTRDVSRIRELRDSGLTQRQIASETGVSKGHVGKILAGWCHVGVAA